MWHICRSSRLAKEPSAYPQHKYRGHIHSSSRLRHEETYIADTYLADTYIAVVPVPRLRPLAA